MALTKSYTESVLNRIRTDKAYAEALYNEAIEAILSGEREEGLAILRDIVNADVGFPKLAAHTDIPEKSLHRMLSRRGNPSVGVFGRIAKGLQDWCRERGITFVLAIGPNKSTIYSEYMPDYVRRADVTFLDLLLKRLDEENVLTVCPKQALLEHRFEKPLYQRLDTHWNGYGSYYMLQELVQKLGLSEKDIPISEFTTSEGDLRKILGVSHYPYTSVDTTVESVPGVKTTEGTTVILNAPGNPTFICYRDSYASALEDYLSYYFDGIMYWQHEIDLDFVEQKRPQYLVLECVERFLPEIMGANQEKCENRY